MDAVRLVTEPRRREILRLLWNGERSAGDIAGHFDLTFGAVSQHLARLREAGFVTVRAEGNHRYYRVDRDGLGPLAALLETMWESVLGRLAEAVEREHHG